MIGIAERVTGLLYPKTCPFCGRVSQEDVCGVCRRRIRYIEEPRCMRCGKPIRQREREYCRDCETRPHVYDRGYALWVHSGGVKYGLYQFKYHNRRIYGRFFADELRRRYGQTVRRWEIGVIIPVPLSKRKRRQRGFNQTEILASEFGKGMGIPVDRKHMVRVRDTSPQKTMDASMRRRNLRGAFAWKGERPVRENVLLIDDIYTTGSTIDSAAAALKQAGAPKVYFLTVSIGQCD